MGGVSVLERNLYTEAEAARLLRVAPSTLHYWLEGGQRGRKSYRPVIRVEPTGSRTVTWAEFIEAWLLRCYRQDHHVPMAELRTFIDVLREDYGVPYPLAHERPFISGRDLVYDAQERAGLDAEFWLVVHARGQLMLTGPGLDFLKRVEFVDDVATAWKPHGDLGSPVRVDPLRRFGRPNVAGVSTEVLWEHVEAGEDPDDVAAAFDLTVSDVRWALSYEYSVRSAA